MRESRAKWVRRFSVLVVVACVGTASFADGDAAANSNSGAEEPASHYYHDGSIRDINAIGHRNVGCGRGVGNWFSLEKQVSLGKSFAQQVESTAHMVNDPVVTEYINRLGQNLVRNSDARVPFTIKVIDSGEINAFALPGGFFYVNSGLILAADNEAELAAVMAHEIGHVAACHAAREQTRGELATFASIPLIFVGGAAGYAAIEAASVALPVGFLKFSRGFEAQADYLGVQYMYKAGYDPQAFLAFFEKIEAQEKKKAGTIAKVFETHPPTPDRMKATQQEIATILPPRQQYILDTSEFEDVKARLSVLENGHKIQNGKNSDQPTLRKAQRKPDNNDPNGSNSGDDRPTLKRRSDPNGLGTTGS